MKKNPAERPFSILYAEDERAIRDLLSAGLSRRYPDIRIDTANNGAAGLDLFIRSHYDLIITDNMMPNMSGLRMVSVIRSISPGMPVIFLSACLTQCGVQDIPIDGEYHFLQKPFRFSELYDLVDRYIKPL